MLYIVHIMTDPGFNGREHWYHIWTTLKDAKKEMKNLEEVEKFTIVKNSCEFPEPDGGYCYIERYENDFYIGA